MLTKKENFLETITGGNPDRLVNQYEFMELIRTPALGSSWCPLGEVKHTDWGYTIAWQEGTPGPFPVHTPEKIAVRDVTKWRKAVRAPNPYGYSDAAWATGEELASSVDRAEKYVAGFMSTGLFERLHFLMGIDNALIALFEEPEATKELIEYIADWTLEYSKILYERIKPDMLFHHDDWGSETNSFFSPETFKEFFVPSYKKLYEFWKSKGVTIVHHCDCYAANLVPSMIDIGIDVWQGAVQRNNIPELLDQYGNRLSIMGGVDNTLFDKADWSHEKIRTGLETLLNACGTTHFIPCMTIGSASSVYPGVYAAVSEEIAALSPKYLN